MRGCSFRSAVPGAMLRAHQFVRPAVCPCSGHARVRALAEFERDLIRERSRAGLAAARARGRVGGRPSVWTPEKREQAERMLADGKSVATVAKVLGVSRATVYRKR